METIFALATAAGKAGIAVIRISGPQAIAAIERMADELPAHGRTLRKLRGVDGEVLDEVLILTFAEGRSFTGETVVELHLHGSIAVISAVLRRLGDDPDLRQAEAGEFTRRALANARLDLAQVEGLADLIDAETEAQRRQALRVLSGALGEKADGWRRSLLRAAALIEATIDFADEDVPVDVMPEVAELLQVVRAEMIRETDGVKFAERVRQGFEVAIIGAPNTGKSTLLNHLAGREAAITSEHEGTTRDVIEVRLDLEGIAVTFLDTAGIRHSDDPVEQIGISRGLERAKLADIRVHLLLPGQAPTIEIGSDDMVVNAKADLHRGVGLSVSGRTGAGIDDLVRQIASILTEKSSMVGLAIRERHRLAMVRAIACLENAMSIMATSPDMADLAAEEMRGAIMAVDSLVGRIDVEDILGEIFSSFCIGK